MAYPAENSEFTTDTEELADSTNINDVQQFEQKLETGISQILKAFEQKLAFDDAKQRQIDSLHTEVQEYKTDLIARTNRPLVNGLIRLHDDIGKLIERHKSKPTEQADIFFKEIENIQDDVEILLDQNGVTTFTELDDLFQPRRQHVLNNTPTTDDEQVGKIATRLRPGFEQGNELIKKERVNVYTLQEQNNE